MTRLKVERLRRGLTQMELGFLAGVAQSDVSRIETVGEGPGSQLGRLGAALGVDPLCLTQKVELTIAEASA